MVAILYCVFAAEVTVQTYMQHKMKLQLKLNQMSGMNRNSYIKLSSFISIKHELARFHTMYINVLTVLCHVMNSLIIVNIINSELEWFCTRDR